MLYLSSQDFSYFLKPRECTFVEQFKFDDIEALKIKISEPIQRSDGELYDKFIVLARNSRKLNLLTLPIDVRVYIPLSENDFINLTDMDKLLYIADATLYNNFEDASNYIFPQEKGIWSTIKKYLD